MKVIIAEAGPANNVGSMALIENAIEIIKEKHGLCEITVLSAHAQSVKNVLEKDNLQQGIKVISDLFLFPKGGGIHKSMWLIKAILWICYSRIVLLFTKNISKFMCGQKKTVLKEIEEAEYIYCIGAERINDVYYKTALLSLYTLGTYIKIGKKVIHLSLTIGPVFYKSTIAVAKRILNKSFAILVRDQKSYDLLKSWKIKAKKQFNAYDIALLQRKKPELLPSLMNEFNLQPGFIGVSVLYWHFRKLTGPSRMPEYYDSLSKTLDYIIEKYDRDIVFTPTVTGFPHRINDDAVASEIINRMKNKNRVINIKRMLTPIELATLYTQCYFSIVTRMHAAILCSGAGEHPIIAINYLYKLREYMKNIGFENYSIDIDYINPKDLKILVDNMFQNYNNNLSKLKKRQLELNKALKGYLQSY